MNYYIIAAVGKNNEIGKKGQLLWRLPEDMQFFKEMTLGKTVIMGRKTFESIGRPLPNRNNIVLTSDKSFECEGITVYNNVTDLFYNCITNREDAFIIGGAKVYGQFINLAKELYLTEVDKEDKNADTYFPEFVKEYYEQELLKETNEFKIKKYTRK